MEEDSHLYRWNFRMSRTETKISELEKDGWDVVVGTRLGWVALVPWMRKGSWVIHSIMWVSNFIIQFYI